MFLGILSLNCFEQSLSLKKTKVTKVLWIVAFSFSSLFSFPLCSKWRRCWITLVRFLQSSAFSAVKQN